MALRSTTAKHDDGVVHTKNNSSYKTKRINNSQFSVTSTPTSFCAQRAFFMSSGRRELTERRELSVFKIDFSTDIIVLAILRRC